MPVAGPDPRAVVAAGGGEQAQSAERVRLIKHQPGMNRRIVRNITDKLDNLLGQPFALRLGLDNKFGNRELDQHVVGVVLA